MIAKADSGGWVRENDPASVPISMTGKIGKTQAGVMAVKDKRSSGFLTVKRRWYWITEIRKVIALNNQKAMQRKVAKDEREAEGAASSSGSFVMPMLLTPEVELVPME